MALKALGHMPVQSLEDTAERTESGYLWDDGLEVDPLGEVEQRTSVFVFIF